MSMAQVSNEQRQALRTLGERNAAEESGDLSHEGQSAPTSSKDRLVRSARYNERKVLARQYFTAVDPNECASFREPFASFW